MGNLFIKACPARESKRESLGSNNREGRWLPSYSSCIRQSRELSKNSQEDQQKNFLHFLYLRGDITEIPSKFNPEYYN